jgi:hypothetical protein
VCEARRARPFDRRTELTIHGTQYDRRLFQHLFGREGRIEAVPCDHTGILSELMSNHVRVSVGRI